MGRTTVLAVIGLGALLLAGCDSPTPVDQPTDDSGIDEGLIDDTGGEFDSAVDVSIVDTQVTDAPGMDASDVPHARDGIGMDGVSCGRAGMACCPGMACDPGLACTAGVCAAASDGGMDSSVEAGSCGTIGQPCCSGATPCEATAVCGAGSTCVACGGAGQSCCAGMACGMGLACTLGVCSAGPACPGRRRGHASLLHRDALQHGPGLSARNLYRLEPLRRCGATLLRGLDVQRWPGVFCGGNLRGLWREQPALLRGDDLW